MKRLPVLIVAVIVAVVAVGGFVLGVVVANDDDDRRGPMGLGMMGAGSNSTPRWWDDSWDSMMGPMSMATAASEPDYLVEMIAHHQEAVEAAGELARSDRPEMRELGESIVESQTDQIEQMQAWLADWYPDVSTDAQYRPMMRDLADLSGDRLDLVFLQDMIGHHMVAVMMSQHLLWQGTDHEEVTDLARSIRDDQHAEIIQMQGWLSDWFDVDWGPGMGMGMGMGMGHGGFMGRY